MTRRLFLFLLAIFAIPLALWAQNTKATDILVLSSQTESSEWAHIMMQPVLDLEKERPDLTVSISYLRVLSHASVESLQEAANSVLDAQERAPRLVAIVGGSCFNFAIDIQNRWPGIPIVLIGEQDYFCDFEYTLLGPGNPDVARFPVSQFRDLGYNLTLVCTTPMYRRTVNLMKTLQPGLDNLIIVAGENYMSKEGLWRIEKYLDERTPAIPYRVISSTDTTTDQLISILEDESGPNTAVFYLSWLVREDYDENVATRYNTLSIIEHIAPVYTLYPNDMEVHPYIVGYYGHSVQEYDRMVRQGLLDILDHGREPEDMPFVYMEAGPPVVNYQAMEHFGLDTHLIPKDAVEINGPRSLWQLYKKHIMWMAFALLMLMFFFVLFIMTRSMLSMRKARNIAQEANKIKTAFIQNMSHEVRTPLNAIVGFSQLLGLPDGTNTEEEKAEYLNYIMNDSELLTVMINDMLSVADMESGRYSVNLQPTNLNEMARQALKSVEYRFPHGVTIIRQPGLAEKDRYIADGMRVQQIMINFLTNACKHTPEGGRILFGSSLMENPGYITFFVEDSGPGVPLDKAESIFERFVKLDSHKQGAGLGLSICRLLAVSMGGNVWLDTSYTDGARFVFTIPCKKANNG